jgi:hypothetical protein
MDAWRYSLTSDFNTASEVARRINSPDGNLGDVSTRFTSTWKDDAAFSEAVNSAFGGIFDAAVPDHLRKHVEGMVKYEMAFVANPENALKHIVADLARVAGPSTLSMSMDPTMTEQGSGVALYPPEKYYALDGAQEPTRWLVESVNSVLAARVPTDENGQPISWSLGKTLGQISDMENPQGPGGGERNVWMQFAGLDSGGNPYYTLTYLNNGALTLVEDDNGILTFNPSGEYKRRVAQQAQIQRDQILNTPPKPPLSSMSIGDVP